MKYPHHHQEAIPYRYTDKAHWLDNKMHAHWGNRFPFCANLISSAHFVFCFLQIHIQKHLYAHCTRTHIMHLPRPFPFAFRCRSPSCYACNQWSCLVNRAHSTMQMASAGHTGRSKRRNAEVEICAISLGIEFDPISLWQWQKRRKAWLLLCAISLCARHMCTHARRTVMGSNDKYRGHYLCTFPPNQKICPFEYFAVVEERPSKGSFPLWHDIASWNDVFQWCSVIIIIRSTHTPIHIHVTSISGWLTALAI